MTLAELKKLKSFHVLKEFSGKYHVDNHHELKADILEMIKEQNLDPEKLTESDYGFSYGNRTWMKPKIKKESYGTITFRSKDYYFTNDLTGSKSFGEMPKASDLTKDGFKVLCFDGNYITYTIVS